MPWIFLLEKGMEEFVLFTHHERAEVEDDYPDWEVVAHIEVDDELTLWPTDRPLVKE